MNASKQKAVTKNAFRLANFILDEHRQETFRNATRDTSAGMRGVGLESDCGRESGGGGTELAALLENGPTRAPPDREGGSFGAA